MKRNCTRVLSLLLMLTLMLGLLSGVAAPAEAATVDYVKNGKTYLRVYEFAGADGTVTLQGYRLHICDLLEQETGECFDETVSVTGRQSRTFRVEKK